MDFQITSKEAGSRLKSKFTTWFGLPLLVGGLFMFVCSITFFLHKNPDLQFRWEQYSVMIGWGYTMFAARDTLIKGMVGLLLPRKKV